MSINWLKVAKPQADGSDVAAIRQIDQYWKPPQIHAPECVTLLDGSIMVDDTRVGLMNSADLLSVQSSQAWADHQSSYLSAWVDGGKMLSAYIDQFWAFKSEGGGMGCISGHHAAAEDAAPYHAVYVSVNDLNGCAQGIYHEAAHLRLESLGMRIEYHDNFLIINGPNELYDSPVRFDKKRPMCAVIHGTYAWIMFTQNDFENYRAGLITLTDFKMYSERNLPKIMNGVKEILSYAKPTAEGEEFLEGMTTWGANLVQECQTAMR